MGLFDAIQNLIGGATGSIGDAVGGLADVPVLQDLQDQATTLTDGVSEASTSATEAVPTAIDDITNNLGL
jgi:X-X-X-Leu-X-X-Gly heptad repeat protein